MICWELKLFEIWMVMFVFGRLIEKFVILFIMSRLILLVWNVLNSCWRLVIVVLFLMMGVLRCLLSLLSWLMYCLMMSVGLFWCWVISCLIMCVLMLFEVVSW